MVHDATALWYILAFQCFIVPKSKNIKHSVVWQDARFFLHFTTYSVSVSCLLPTLCFVYIAYYSRIMFFRSTPNTHWHSSWSFTCPLFSSSFFFFWILIFLYFSMHNTFDSFFLCRITFALLFNNFSRERRQKIKNNKSFLLSISFPNYRYFQELYRSSFWWIGVKNSSEKL